MILMEKILLCASLLCLPRLLLRKSRFHRAQDLGGHEIVETRDENIFWKCTLCKAVNTDHAMNRLTRVHRLTKDGPMPSAIGIFFHKVSTSGAAVDHTNRSRRTSQDLVRADSGHGYSTFGC